MVRARARKKVPVTPVTEMRGRKTTMGVTVDPMRGRVISARALRTASMRFLAGFTVEGDVFDDDDGVIDDEADSGSESAEGHEVKALADGPEHNKCNSNGYRNDEAGDEGGSPVAQEEDDDDRGEDESDEDGIADAGDAVANEMGLVVEGGDGDAGGQIGAELGDGGGDFVGDGDGVRVGLLEDVEEDGGLAVGGNDGVDGLRGRDDLSDVGEVNRARRRAWL